MRPIATSLTEAQVRDAVAAFRRLARNNRPLAFCLGFALANYREPEKQKLFTEAVTSYAAAKKHELEQDYISLPQFDRIRWELKRLEAQSFGRIIPSRDGWRTHRAATHRLY